MDAPWDKLWVVVYHLQVTVTLNMTSDLVDRIIMSRAHPILFEVGIFHFWVTVILTSDLVFNISIKSGAYLYSSR